MKIDLLNGGLNFFDKKWWFKINCYYKNIYLH